LNQVSLSYLRVTVKPVPLPVRIEGTATGCPLLSIVIGLPLLPAIVALVPETVADEAVKAALPKLSKGT
jgi:hypothetical protein